MDLIKIALIVSFMTVFVLGDESFEFDFCQQVATGNPTANYAHPLKCDAFITCENFYHPHDRNAKATVQYCPGGLLFDENIGVCNWARAVKCYLFHGEVCYGARGNQYGVFHTLHAGRIQELKLVHKSGYVTCNKNRPNFKSFWGCNSPALKNKVNTHITTTADAEGIIFPEEGTPTNNRGYYKLGNTKPTDPTIIWSLHPRYAPLVEKHQEFRVWFGEDLLNRNQGNNDGEHCAYVYVVYSYYKPYYFSEHVM